MEKTSRLKLLRFGIPTLGIIALVLGGCAFSNSRSASPASTQAATQAVTIDESGFMWGASIVPYPTGPSDPAVLNQVFSLAKNLGLKVVRLEIPTWEPTDQQKFAYIDPVVDAANKAGIAMDLIIEPDWVNGENVYTEPNLASLAQQRAETVVSHYKGKVQYYQLANEIPTASLKTSWSGATTDAYNQDSYASSLAWLKASSAGIRATDPTVKINVTGSWLQYGFFEKAFKDGLDVDILGWDWFDESNDIHQLSDNGQKLDLIQKLEQFNKPIWFVEAGYSASTHTEAQQADLDRAFLADISSIPAVKGAMVEVFVDSVNQIGTKGQYDGIVSLDISNLALPKVGAPKPAYDAIKALISSTK